MRKFAFTLAEVLIVIWVIGIVAALTIPNLNSSTADKEKIAKVKKLYQNLNDAYGRAKVVYGSVEEWTVSTADDKTKAKKIGERLVDFLKVTKNCEQNNTGSCFYNGIIGDPRGVGGVVNTNINTNAYRFVLADGSAVAVLKDRIVVDIDGPLKGKKGYGRGIFTFLLDKDKGVTIPDTVPTMGSLLTTASTGAEAAYWVLNFDNMDYLKTKDNNGNCSNSDVKLDATANPPVVSCK